MPRQLPSGDLSLSFLKCRPEDEGKYACTARNKHGEKTTEAPFKVIPREAKDQPHCGPSFIKPLQDIKAEEGNPLVLEAELAGNPLPHVKWFMDDQPLSTSSTVCPAFDGRKATLSIASCHPSRHAGVYECRASNVVGDVCSRALVSIVGKEAPRFVEKLSDMQFSTNKPMTLCCRVTGVPTPEVEWFFHRSPVYPGVKYQVSREGEKCLLTLPHPRIKDTGTYECKAKNVAGKAETSAYVTVTSAELEGEAPMFLKKLKDISIPNGTTAKLTACICGSPKPEVKWFKDGQQLSANSRIKMEAESNGVVRLLVEQAMKQDVGTYRLSIANQFGSETCTTTLNVEGDDKVKSDVPKREIPKAAVHGPPTPLAHAPYIFKMSDDSISLGWGPSISRGPQPPPTYRLEMCQIPNGQWTTYKSGIKDTSCDVRDLLPGTDYRFRVRVENRYGTSEPSPYVSAHRSRLLHRPATPTDHTPKDYDLEHLKLDKYAAAPRFLRLDEDSAYAERGHPARIEFWVYGCPQPKITWFFNNEQVDTSRYDFLEDRGGQVILFITRMREEDVGTYTCKAVNEHGEAQRKIEMKIAEMPIFTKRLEPCTTLARGKAEFRCRAIGTPNPKIRWFKDWQPLAESSRFHIRQEEPDVCVLTLSDAILRDGGLYTCTAANVAGTATTSAMLTVEECEEQYGFKTYQRPRVVKTSQKPFEDFYDIGDELGRGTQGITYHVVDRRDGRSLAAKVMHGPEHMLDVMRSELDIMGELCHPRLLRLQDAHETKSSLTLTADLCGGGELLPNILHRGTLTESLVAHYVKQILEGLKHMHQKNIAHLGLTIGDVLLTRVNGDNVKVGDFGLAARLYPGRELVQEYGHPEFVAPEVANKQPVSLAADLWSVGIISYILLVGESPFLRENDRETLKAVQQGKADFFHGGFAVLSDEARDFVTKLLQPDPSQRLDVDAALKHKWLQLDDIPDKCDELENIDRLKEYYRKWKAWYANAQCRWFYRRRTLESCFTHPSRMIYPPDEVYTPPLTPDREVEGRSHFKPAAFDDLTYRQKIEREVIDPRSESHYQSGPDTFLLPLRDPDFPVRVRRYLKVAVRERRKFVDVMDEEIWDEKRGVGGASPHLRIRHEVGTPGSEYEHHEREQAIIKRRRPGTLKGWAPFFREKIRHCAVREGEDAVFRCRVTAQPSAQVSWFRNDGILVESSRILMGQYSDGLCTLTLRPAKAYDVGVYKCVARNSHGITTCRARLHLGTAPNKPDPPHADCCSDTEVLLRWNMSRDDAFVIPTLGYSIEQKQEGTEEWTKMSGVFPTHEFYLVRGLSPATSYRFRIRSRNKFGWSDLSSPSEPVLTLAEASPKIELCRGDQFHQEQAESGIDPALSEGEEEGQELDYLREEEPIKLEKKEPTEVCNYISEIARGRFSLVMKVWHKEKNTALVAKAISLQKDKDAAWRELSAHCSLVHEHLPLLHAALEGSGSMLFLIMEKLDAVDVLRALSSRALYSEEAVSRIIIQVLDAIEYLHFRNLCYLELQPDNVLLLRPYFTRVKLVDFGSVREEESTFPKEQSPASCPEYLAPEILKGEDVIHTPADIWSVGVLTYILLSGVSPFAGETPQETKDNVQWVRYHFDHLHREASPEATHFLMQLFKRTPQKRPTASECLENKWLLPAESLIRKREKTLFPSHALREFSEKFHSQKAAHTPQHLLNMYGKKEEETS
ncbi:obscurin-like [Uloborus diversus]|uniref:obscurin-like n=1 Tax=Uloborus diversus TaxID=327109 RepID=UPI0024096A60|nr:obscurin-like [Uloborus diversus]